MENKYQCVYASDTSNVEFWGSLADYFTDYEVKEHYTRQVGRDYYSAYRSYDPPRYAKPGQKYYENIGETAHNVDVRPAPVQDITCVYVDGGTPLLFGTKHGVYYVEDGKIVKCQSIESANVRKIEKVFLDVTDDQYSYAKEQDHMFVLLANDGDFYYSLNDGKTWRKTKTLALGEQLVDFCIEHFDSQFKKKNTIPAKYYQQHVMYVQTTTRLYYGHISRTGNWS